MAADDDDALFPLPPVEETEAVQKEEPGPVRVRVDPPTVLPQPTSSTTRYPGSAACLPEL